MSKDRVEAFSDRVFSVVLTLFVLSWTTVLAKNLIRPQMGHGLDAHNAPIMDSDGLSRDQFAALVIQSISVPSNSILTSAHRGDTLSINSRSRFTRHV
jgi:hypothetical protein